MTRKNSIFWLGFISIYLLAFLLQTQLLLNWDVSWLMLTTKKLLSGGHYGKDFFEINPPMILYLYIPPVLISKFFLISRIFALRIYIFLLTSISLLLCYPLLKKILANSSFNKLFLLVMASIFLILPTYEFGQREHLLLILIMPYILLAANRIENYSIKKRYIFLSGLLAGFGFSIKPYFLAIFIAIEFFYLLVTRRLFAWFRLETLLIIAIVLIYLGSTKYFYPEYFDITRLMRPIYPLGFHTSRLILLLEPTTLFCLMPLILFFAFRSINVHKTLSAVLLTALIGALIAYFIQSAWWYYHIFPALSLAVLVLLLLLDGFYQKIALALNKLERWIGMSVLSFVFFFYPLFWITITSSWAYFSYKIPMNHLIQFIEAHARNKPILFFATSTIYAFPAVEYANATYAGRFAFQGWLVNALHDKSPTIPYKDFFINMIADDINNQKPLLIFIDIAEKKGNLDNIKLDYLNYFGSNQKFKRAFKAYHYFTTIEEPNVYRFAVYKRT